MVYPGKEFCSWIAVLNLNNEAINKIFSPEFRNRIDAIIHFNHLNREIVLSIVNKFIIDSDVIQIDRSDSWDKTRHLVRRRDSDDIWKIYDKVNHTFEFPDDDYLNVNVIRHYKYEDIPAPFQRYIIYKASGRAAVQLVGNPQLQKMLATFEAQARASCMEYECNQGDHNFMGWPDDSAYQSYKPYQSLRR